ncbi:MAG: protein kinase [Rhodobacterales bacterium]|nr:protein kinase [Rhodobacterales bacterium]
MSSPSSAIGPLWNALRNDAVQLELTLARVGQAIGFFALLISLCFSALVSSDMGFQLALFSTWTLAWFTLSHTAMKIGWARQQFTFVNPMVEVVIPGFGMLVLTKVGGAEYALGSWVPPQMFALFISASIFRLRPALPIFMGCVAAIEYGIIYFMVVLPVVGSDPPLWALPAVQYVRMATLVLMGAAGSAAVVLFRRTMARALGSVRGQDLFGKYRLGAEIASGGMGTVFAATYCPEGGFERPVAIKRIHPHLAKNEAFLARFRTEAELCARLAHPNIVAAMDFGRVDDSYFFAMEFIDGVTLHDVLSHHRLTNELLPTSVVCWLVRQILEGLKYAHSGARDRRGKLLHIVHRDLSPHNVLLDVSGQVKISDFGVARALGDAQDMHTRNMAGKPAYMAPEQLSKNQLDERADLFSIGILTWEALTNRRLFRRNNEGATILAVMDGKVPRPSSLRPQLSGNWDNFCVRALAPKPEDRFQSAAGMLVQLAEIQQLDGFAGPDEVGRLVMEAREENLPDLELDA